MAARMLQPIILALGALHHAGVHLPALVPPAAGETEVPRIFPDPDPHPSNASAGGLDCTDRQLNLQLTQSVLVVILIARTSMFTSVRPAADRPLYYTGRLLQDGQVVASEQCATAEVTTIISWLIRLVARYEIRTPHAAADAVPDIARDLRTRVINLTLQEDKEC
jgi:hypothetical protein